MRRYFVGILVVLAALPLPILCSETTAGQYNLRDVILRALSQNQELKAARQTWQTARSRKSPARAWDDPSVGISQEKMPEGEKIKHWSVSQDIPFPGKRILDGQLMTHDTIIEEARFRAKQWDIRSQAQILYYQLHRSDQLISQLNQAVESMRITLRVAQSKLPSSSSSSSRRTNSTSSSVGMGMGERGNAWNPTMGPSGSTGVDIFSLMAELGQMENQLYQEKQMRRMVVYELNTLLDQPLKSPPPPTQAPQMVPHTRTLDETLKLAQDTSPYFVMALHEERHSESQLQRAKMDFLPDFGLMYEQRKTEMGLSGHELGVEFKIPLWFSRPWGTYQEATFHRGEAMAMAKQKKNETLNQIATEYIQTETRLELVGRYESEVLPAAESAFKLARRQYESGEGNILRLLDTLRTYISVQIQYDNELYHYSEHRALLERWLGAPYQSVESVEGMIP